MSCQNSLVARSVYHTLRLFSHYGYEHCTTSTSVYELATVTAAFVKDGVSRTKHTSHVFGDFQENTWKFNDTAFIMQSSGFSRKSKFTYLTETQFDIALKWKCRKLVINMTYNFVCWYHWFACHWTNVNYGLCCLVVWVMSKVFRAISSGGIFNFIVNSIHCIESEYVLMVSQSID